LRLQVPETAITSAPITITALVEEERAGRYEPVDDNAPVLAYAIAI
jgi:hypothetical protein